MWMILKTHHANHLHLSFFCGNLDVIFGCDNWAVGGGLLVVLELWYFNGISRGSIRIQGNLTLMKFEEILCGPKQKQKLLWPFCGYCVSSNQHVQIFKYIGGIPSLKLTAKAPENGWLEYEFPVSFWGVLAYFQGRLLLVSGRDPDLPVSWVNCQSFEPWPGFNGRFGWLVKKPGNMWDESLEKKNVQIFLMKGRAFLGEIWWTNWNDSWISGPYRYPGDIWGDLYDKNDLYMPQPRIYHCVFVWSRNQGYWNMEIMPGEKNLFFSLRSRTKGNNVYTMAWDATIENSQTLQAPEFQQQTHISSTYLARNPDHTTPINMAEYMPILDEGPKPITDLTIHYLYPTKWLFHTRSNFLQLRGMSDNKNASPARFKGGVPVWLFFPDFCRCRWWIRRYTVAVQRFQPFSSNFKCVEIDIDLIPFLTWFCPSW